MRGWKSDIKQCCIQSISQDVIFATSSGPKLPSKHLKLGVALKSLTGSRKVVELLNHYGHCTNYHAVEENETELTFSATETQMETPNGLSACSKVGIRCGFDNFDRFSESQSGKSTLHDTVGISHELICSEVNGSSDAESNDQNTQEKTTDDLETYPTTTSREQVKSKTGTLEIGFSNGENSVSITEYGKAKLEVVEKIKNKKRRQTYEPRELDVVPYRKQRPPYTSLRQSKVNFDKSNRRKRGRNMEEKILCGWQT